MSLPQRCNLGDPARRPRRHAGGRSHTRSALAALRRATACLLAGPWLAACSTSRPPAPPPPDLTERWAGTWDGVVVFTPGENEIDFTLELAQGPTGQWLGTLTAPLVGLEYRPLAHVAVQDTILRFDVADQAGSGFFTARWEQPGRLAGSWQRLKRSAPLELTRQATPRPVPGPQPLQPARELHAAFDRDQDCVRLILLLSPT
jgi:hypothetical protein